MTLCSIEPRTRKYIKGYEFLLFSRNVSDKYGEKILDTATKTRLDDSNLLPEKYSLNS